MTRTPIILMLFASAALAGCEGETIVAGPGVHEEAGAAQVTNVQLPPSITASKIYRCSGDNSVVHIDWLSDNKTANVRTEAGGSVTQLTAAEEGQPLTSTSGMSVAGTPQASSVSVTLPGQSAKTCKA